MGETGLIKPADRAWDRAAAAAAVQSFGVFVVAHRPIAAECPVPPSLFMHDC